MSELSEEQTAIPAVPPQGNPPPGPNYSFYLKMKPIRTLKLAIEALLDPAFNNDGFGIVGPVGESLEISVKNNNNNATASLFLKSSGMIEFQNNVLPPPIVALSASLRLISQGFPRDLDGDDDTVVIFHVKGTNRLHFEFGTVPATGLWVEIDVIHHVSVIPGTASYNSVTLPVEYMSQINNYILHVQDHGQDDTVYVVWKEDFGMFTIGCKKEETSSFHASFNWRYTSLIKEAYFLADKVSLYFLTVPEQHVMFQFHMGELADLYLLDKAVWVIPAEEAGARGEDVSDDSVTVDTPSTS